jgi:hypothetical protein
MRIQTKRRLKLGALKTEIKEGTSHLKSGEPNRGMRLFGTFFPGFWRVRGSDQGSQDVDFGTFWHFLAPFGTFWHLLAPFGTLFRGGARKTGEKLCIGDGTLGRLGRSLSPPGLGFSQVLVLRDRGSWSGC